jgi:hypothetical protein
VIRSIGIKAFDIEVRAVQGGCPAPNWRQWRRKGVQTVDWLKTDRGNCALQLRINLQKLQRG